MKEYALITGASSGLGIEFARIAAKEYNLILTGRNKERLEKIKNELLTKHDIDIVTFIGDLSKDNFVKELYTLTTSQKLNVKVLINNAGFGDLSPLFESNYERQLEMIRLNMESLTTLSYLYGKDMKKTGGGKILNISSSAGICPGPNMSVYYATKAYVLSFSLGLNGEAKETKVTSTALCPGPTNTAFIKNANYQFSKAGKSKLADPYKVALLGYNAMKKGKGVVYSGFLTKMNNFMSRIFSRSYMANIAKSFNASKNS